MQSPYSKKSFSVSCQNISLSYEEKNVFFPQDFSLSANEKILIEWPSWSGKTSFLRLLSGLILPVTGSVIYNYDGEYIDTHSPEFSHFRRENMSMTFAEPLFFDTLTVDQNIMFPHIFLHLPYEKKWKNELIDTLGIALLLPLKIEALSSGEKDRVNIIRALLYDRPILFLDEPGAHMDRNLFEVFLYLLESYLLRTKPLTIIISHSDRYRHIVDRTYICENGIFTLLP